MDELRNLLLQLHGVSSSGKIDDARRVSENLLTFVRSFDAAENDGAIAELLFSDIGLEQSCKRIIATSLGISEESEECTLNILLAFLELLPGMALHREHQDAELRLKALALSILNKAKKAKTKENSLRLLNELLDVRREDAQRREEGRDEKWAVGKLVEKLKKDLESTRFTPTVKREALRLLGKIAEQFPRSDLEDIKQILMSQLKSQMDLRRNKVEYSILTGCIEGITGLWSHFSVEDEKSDVDIVFRCVLRLLDPDLKLRQSGEMPRAALKLLATHAEVMAGQIFKNADESVRVGSKIGLYDCLLKWCDHANPSSMKAGRSALDKFLGVLCSALVRNKDNDNDGKRVFRRFVSDIHKMAEASDIHAKDLGSCIKGYGYFAGPCSAYYSGADLNRYFRSFVDFGSTNLLESADEKRFGVLPDFFKSLSSIILVLEREEAESVVIEKLPVMERLAVRMMEKFPEDLHPATQKSVAPSLLAFIYALETNGFVVPRSVFLKVVVRQSIIRACSHERRLEVAEELSAGREQSEPDEPTMPKLRKFGAWTDAVTYESYVDVWVKLLSGLNAKELKDYGLPPTCENFNEEIVRETIACVMQITEDLNLNTELIPDEEEGNPGADVATSPDVDVPMVGLVASNVDDVAFFANLVEFANLLLLERSTSRYRRIVRAAMPSWLFAAINWSEKFPLVSGFYKMIRLGFLLVSNARGEQLKDDREEAVAVGGEDGDALNPSQEQEADAGDEGLLDDLNEKICSYVSKVIVRCQQYTDELLLSCLRMVCSLPIEVVESFLNEVVLLMKVIFEKGLSYPPLAQEGLVTLKRWSVRLSLESKRTIFYEVVPVLELYLRSSDAGGDDFTELTSNKRLPKTAAARRKRRQKILETKRSGANVENFVSLADIQTSILSILGGFCLSDSVVSGVVLGDVEKPEDKTVGWSPVSGPAKVFNLEQPLMFPVPFMDMQPEIAIDRFIPRIVQLAVEASDRKTRIAACETLHAVVIFLIGTDSIGGDDEAVLARSRRYCVFPALLRLGADDGDLAVKSMFKPFVCQITRWFLANTGKPKQSKGNCGALLDSILDAIVERGSSSLRNASGDYLKDFFVMARDNKREYFMDEILHWIATQAQHNDPHRRFGASFAFHAIHIEFRETERFVDRYGFFLCVAFVKSMDVSHFALPGTVEPLDGTPEDLVGAEIVERALNHLRRSMVFSPHRRSMLLSTKGEMKRRKAVDELNEQSVENFLEWLFLQALEPPYSRQPASSSWARKKQTECLATLKYLAQRVDQIGPLDDLVTRLVRKFETRIETVIKEHGALVFSMSFVSWLLGTLGRHNQLGLRLWGFCFTAANLKITADILGGTGNARDLRIAVLEALSAVDVDTVVHCFDRHRENGERFLRALAMGVDENSEGVLKLLGRLEGTPWFDVVADTLRSQFTREDAEQLFNLESYDDTYEKMLNLMISLRSAGPNVLSRAVEECCWMYGRGKLRHCFNSRFSKNPGLLKYAKSLLTFCLTLDFVNEKEIANFILSFLVHVDCRQELYRRVAGGNGDRELADEILNVAFSDSCGAKRDVAFELIAGALGAVPASAYENQPTCGRVLEPLVDRWDEICAWFESRRGTTETGHRTDEGQLVQLGHSILVAYTQLQSVSSANATDSDDTWTSRLVPVASYFVERFIVDESAKIRFSSAADLLGFFAIYCSKCYVDHCSEDCVHREAVRKTMTKFFPMRSNEYAKKSADWEAHRSAFRALFAVFRRTEDPAIFRIVSRNLLREDGHEHEVTLYEVLVAYAENHSDHVVQFLDHIWNVDFWGRDLKTDKGGPEMEKLRRKILSRVSCRVLELCDESERVAFARKHIRQMMEACTLDFDFNDGNCFRGLYSSVERLQAFLTLKRGCFQVLEVLIRTLPKTLTDENSRLSALAVDPRFYDDPQESEEALRARLEQTSAKSKARLNKDLILAAKDFIEGKPWAREAQTAFQLSKDDPAYCEDIDVALREARCWALNCMIACLRKHGKGIEAFKLVFPGRKEMDKWWANIVDVKANIVFESELERYPQKLRFSTSSGRRLDGHRSGQRRRQRPWETSASGASASLKFLGDSTLSRDVSQFDFSNAGSAIVVDRPVRKVKEGVRTVGQEAGADSSLASADDGEMQLESKDDVFEFELDSLNQHPSMAQLTSALRFVLASKEAREASGKTPPAMVTVLSNIRAAILYGLEPNVRKFLIKLVYNCRDALRPWGPHFVDAALEIIVGEVIGDSLNYVTLDLSVMALEWAKEGEMDDSMRTVISRYCEFVVSKCADIQRSDVRRAFIDVLSTAVRMWKNVVTPPTQTFAFLVSDRTESGALGKNLKAETGLQTMAAFLVHGVFPCTAGGTGEEQVLRGTLSFLETRKDLPSLRLAAEVVGLLLKELSKDASRTPGGAGWDPVSEFVTSTAKYVAELTKDPIPFIRCLDRMRIHYPVISGRFINRVSHVLPKLDASCRASGLEMIATGIDVQDRVFRLAEGNEGDGVKFSAVDLLILNMKPNRSVKTVDLLDLPFRDNAAGFAKSIGLFDHLTQRNPSCQIAAVQVFEKLAPLLSEDQNIFENYAAAVVEAGLSPDPRCRSAVYDACARLAGRCEIFLTALRRGMNDVDPGLRLRCLGFWSERFSEFGAAASRLNVVLGAIYSPETMSNFVPNSLYLLLELTARSPDYEVTPFVRPLSSHVSFRTYEISSKSRRTRATLLNPMFTLQAAAHRRGVRPRSDLDPSIMTTVRTSVLTLDHEANGTSDGIANDEGGHRFGEETMRHRMDISLTQAEGVDWVTQRTPEPSFMHTEDVIDGSTALVVSAAGGGSRKRTHGEAFKRPLPPGSRAIPEDEELQHIKRRFVKSEDGEDKAVVFMKREERKKAEKERRLAAERADKVESISLLRTYKVGPVPDIQIPRKDFIRPLQLLAQMDASVAKLLFTSVVVGIAEKSKDAPGFRADLTRALNVILSTASVPYPPLILGICDVISAFPCEVQVDLKQLVKCVASAGTEMAGIVALEESVLRTMSSGGVRGTFSEGADPGKKINRNKQPWLHLIELYDAIDEPEVCRGIFRDLVEFSVEVTDVFEAAAARDYKALLEATNAVREHRQSATRNEAEVVLSLRHKSLVKLGSVSSLLRSGRGGRDESSLEWVWDDPEFLDKYLPVLFKVTLKKYASAFSKKESEDRELLDAFLKNAMYGPEAVERLEILNASFGFELALVQLLDRNFVMARDILKKHAFRGLATNWASVGTLNRHERREKIFDLHRLSDLEVVVEIALRKSPQAREAGFKHIISVWASKNPEEARLPGKDVPLEVWDDVITYRLIYASFVFKTCPGAFPSGAVDSLRKFNEQLKLHMARAAVSHGDFVTFDRQWREAIKDKPFAKQKREWSRLKVEREILEADRSPKDMALARKVLVTWVHWDDARDEAVYWDLGAGIAERVASILELFPDELSSLFLGIEDVCAELFQFDENELSVDRVRPALFKYALKMLRKCVQAEPQSIDRRIRLFEFCREHLNRPELSEVEESLAATAMRSLLFTLKSESKEGWQMIPVGLQLLVTHRGETADIFAAEIDDVPTWLFLHWVPQMTSMLHMKESRILRPVLEKVAKKYPQALNFPLRCSTEGPTWDGLKVGAEECSFVEQLRGWICNPILDDLVTALGYVAPASTVLKDYAVALTQLFREAESVERKSGESASNHFGILAADMQRFFCDSVPSRSKVNEGSSIRGPYFDDVCALYDLKMLIKQIAALDRISGFAELEREVKDIRSFLINAMNAEEKKRHPSGLFQYSPWLAATSFVGKNVELPGQYVGFRKPDVLEHVMLAGFDTQVITMKSLRYPKVITVRASDNKDRRWIVKYGEDLRMDERVQKLFGIMNEIFAADPVCKRDPAGDCYQITTYMVAPLTQALGIIGWIDDTVVLDSAIGRTKENALIVAEAQRKYAHAVSQYAKEGGGSGISAAYERMYADIPLSSKIRRGYAEAANTVPWDFFRNFFTSMAQSSPSSASALASPAASFYALRCRFTVSWAIMCVGHWILGVGDRHLRNTLISARNGAAIGIDFGMTFGYATMNLAVPEMMPMRLTPQILGVMAPYGEHGKFKSAMVNALEALRKNQRVLLATMSVFIWEPSLDWTRASAAADPEADCSQKVAEKVTWYPERIRELVKMKLNGANPAEITRRELLMGRREKRFVEGCLATLHRADAKRNKLPRDGLTAEEQVDCLIDQATDVAILGRSWSGWSPFI